ncbi:unnamed protein product [marine sediment metagenome]|uniref:Uncharacterized protein n=1 Tax=marine sediment metagenome TaxID=412755 RepID=X1Q6C2_9ZZZZ
MDDQRWGTLPKCLVTNKGCPDYYRGRCRRVTHCSYKEGEFGPSLYRDKPKDGVDIPGSNVNGL